MVNAPVPNANGVRWAVVVSCFPLFDVWELFNKSAGTNVYPFDALQKGAALLHTVVSPHTQRISTLTPFSAQGSNGVGEHVLVTV